MSNTCLKMDSNTAEQEQPCCCISHLFFKAASLHPQKIAVIHAPPSPSLCDDAAANPRPSSELPVRQGNLCFTFSDVLESVDSLAYRLRSTLNAAPHSHLTAPPSSPPARNRPEEQASKDAYKPKIIGIYMPPSVEYIVSVLSVLRCGEAFLPLDPSWPRDRVLSIVSSSKADLVMVSQSFFGKGTCFNVANESDSGFGCPLLCFSMEERCQGVGAGVCAWPCQREEQRLFCYLMYTSGSTGKPKGVCGTEQGLLNRFLWMQESYPLRGEEVLLFKTAISFVDHLQEFVSAILAACTLVIPPFNKLKESILSLIDYLQAYSISRLTAVPSLMRAILPALKHKCSERIQNSLKLLVLSGEIFPISLWDALSKILPTTTILNLYGSTEVSGDCTCFDCVKLPMILETESLTSVPIGAPISHCDVVLVSENDTPNQGEIHVGGLCVSKGYFDEPTANSLHFVQVHKSSSSNSSINVCGTRLYYRTGDLAQQLESGDLVFLGRMDRTVKVNGQRVALEEVESVLKGHSDVADAAVISRELVEGQLFLDAFIMPKEKDISVDFVRESIRSWMIGKVPLSMVPNRYLFTESWPVSSSGKVDYTSLANSAFPSAHAQEEIGNGRTPNLLEDIRKAFCDALMLEVVSGEDDFFTMGGNSIAAAHVSYNLGIDMRLLYKFPTPSKLHDALLQKEESYHTGVKIDAHRKWNLKAGKSSVSYSVNSTASNLHGHQSWKRKHESSDENNDDNTVLPKNSRIDLSRYILKKHMTPNYGHHWSSSTLMMCSFSRCNKVVHGSNHGLSNERPVHWLTEVPGNEKGFSMQELWKVHLDSCVDASPLVVFKNQDIYLFIGSHAQKFLCINAKSGSVNWEVKLEGRIECSAAIVSDFSQVVVGCYRGNIYFLDFSNGEICWTFQTSGEVKSQPVVDIHRQLIWCGSHDHNLYALDYKGHCCVYKLPCGGSIFASPAIDEANDMLFVASTSGRLTALSIKASPFHILWQHELEVPVFGSLSVASPSGNVICCLVDGSVVALDMNGSILWKFKTAGPIFGGACMSQMLPSQVLICSRSGSLYSLNMESGDLLWEYAVGDAITASAYVDEDLQLVSQNSSLLSDRLICVCASSGSMHLLQISLGVTGKEIETSRCLVKECARLELQGEIFSSPVMIGGRVFVGCRDDYVHCIAIETKDILQKNEN